MMHAVFFYHDHKVKHIWMRENIKNEVDVKMMKEN